jgi:hypothetical protein
VPLYLDSTGGVTKRVLGFLITVNSTALMAPLLSYLYILKKGTILHGIFILPYVSKIRVIHSHGFNTAYNVWKCVSDQAINGMKIM